MRRTKRISLPALLLAASALLVGVLGLPFGEGLVGEREAHAIRGRPLTPMSYAGVARRTSRRTVRRTAAYGGGYYAAPPAYAPPPYYAPPPAPYW